MPGSERQNNMFEASPLDFKQRGNPFLSLVVVDVEMMVHQFLKRNVKKATNLEKLQKVKVVTLEQSKKALV